MYSHKCTLKNLKICKWKSDGMHIWQLKCKTFQGPQADPGPWPILACFTHPAPLHYVRNISEKNSASPPGPNLGSASGSSGQLENLGLDTVQSGDLEQINVTSKIK